MPNRDLVSLEVRHDRIPETRLDAVSDPTLAMVCEAVSDVTLAVLDPAT